METIIWTCPATSLTPELGLGTTTHFVTTFIDRNPSLKALLSCLDISGNNLHSSLSSDPLVHHHRRRPFLHLTCVGTLNDDFFFRDDDNDRSLFSPNPKTQSNGSFVILNNFDSKLRFLNFVTDNGIRVSKIVRSSFSFKAPEEIAEIELEEPLLGKIRASKREGELKLCSVLVNFSSISHQTLLWSEQILNRRDIEQQQVLHLLVPFFGQNHLLNCRAIRHRLNSNHHEEPSPMATSFIALILPP